MNMFKKRVLTGLALLLMSANVKTNQSPRAVSKKPTKEAVEAQIKAHLAGFNEMYKKDKNYIKSQLYEENRKAVCVNTARKIMDLENSNDQQEILQKYNQHARTHCNDILKKITAQ